MSNPFAKQVKDSGVKAKATKDGTVERIATIIAALAAARKAKHAGVLIVPKGFDNAAKVAAFTAQCKADKVGVTVHVADILTVKQVVEAAVKQDGKAQVFDHFTVGKNARAYLIG